MRTIRIGSAYSLAILTGTAASQQCLTINWECLSGTPASYPIDQSAFSGDIRIQSTSIGSFPTCTASPPPASFATCTSSIGITKSFSGALRRLDVNDGASGTPFRIYLGSSLGIPNSQPTWIALAGSTPSKLSGSWGGLDATDVTGNTVVFYGGINGDLTGSISGVDQLIRFDADGAINAPISAGSVVGSNGIRIVAGSLSANGDITTDRIQQMLVANDSAGDINVSGNITLNGIEIGGNSTGNIIVSGDVSGPVAVGGELRRLLVSGTVSADITAGSLGENSGSVLPPINVGEMTASVICDGSMFDPVAIGSWPVTDELFSIGGSFLSRKNQGTAQANRMFILNDPTPGSSASDSLLQNQIIINANNSGGVWSGDISINYQGNGQPTTGEILIGPNQSQPYKAPYYEALPSTLGGGAIGLAPFNFHPKASVPEQSGSVTLTTTSEQENYEAVIEHYGPVFADSSPAVLIERRIDMSSGWVDVTSQFTVTVADSSDPRSREVRIKPSTGNAWVTAQYRVSPDELRCADVAGTPSVVYLSGCEISCFIDHYGFAVNTSSACQGSADVNGDGFVTPADFSAWVAAFNAMGPGCDQNGDSACTPADFSAWVSNYNNGCL